MAYWWVSQNQTYEEEHGGGYLWAPKAVEKTGRTPHHWRTMADVRPRSSSNADYGVWSLGPCATGSCSPMA